MYEFDGVLITAYICIARDLFGYADILSLLLLDAWPGDNVHINSETRHIGKTGECEKDG